MIEDSFDRIEKIMPTTKHYMALIEEEFYLVVSRAREEKDFERAKMALAYLLAVVGSAHAKAVAATMLMQDEGHGIEIGFFTNAFEEHIRKFMHDIREEKTEEPIGGTGKERH